MGHHRRLLPPNNNVRKGAEDTHEQARREETFVERARSLRP